MNEIWLQFVDSLEDIRCLLRQGLRKVVPVRSGDHASGGFAWDRSESLLDSVLLPTDEYAYLKCRIENGQRYYIEGEAAAADYEIALAQRRACKLRRLYG